MNSQALRPLLFFFFSSLSFWGQAQCLYTLEMLDGFGDGWNGGVLTVNSGGNISTFTLDNVNDDGIDSTLTFNVLDGVPLILSYTQGSFPWEVSFNIYDNTGELYYQVTYPLTGALLNASGECIACGTPKNFEVENVWDNRARLRWQPNNAGTNMALNWQVIYGLQGFSLPNGEGDTLEVALPKITITGLQKKTWYDAYLLQYCDTLGGYSEVVGPISFQTYWTNDIGPIGVVAPLSGCDLGADSVKVVLKNHGAAPQSLFNFRYAVNGTPAPVVPPADGFFTGILGKDSSVVIAFETLTNFSAPGEYRIDVYTELPTDEDLANDTFTYYLTNRLQPTYVQQFEVWNGGWNPTGQNPSWEFGAPAKPSIPAAANGQNAWVTHLASNYNPSEKSYLESPCFDFSELTEDASIEISIIRDLEENYDGTWLEMSLDAGQNWEKIGAIGEGLNWYTETNDNFGLGDVWSGESNGWVTARHTLPNSAGESEVHLRFGMSSDPFVQLGGFGIDDVRIFESPIKDLAGIGISTLGETNECGLALDQVAFTFVNFGTQPQSGIKVAYSINGAAPVVENVVGSLAANNSITHSFFQTFDSRDGAFEIKCWTILTGDQALSNDTFHYTVSHIPLPLPYQEDFETYTLPPTNWTYTPTFGFSVTNTHNNVSKVLAFNLYAGNPEFSAAMPRLGLVQEGDSLRFTYRITNFASQGQTPTILQGGTKIEIQVSTDCGENYQTIHTISSFNHTPTIMMREKKLSLSNYAGQAIKIRFFGTWGASDMWVDIDNINILSCAADMNLSADITPATPGLSDGTATVHVGLGNPPYAYVWSNGSTEQTATDLEAGTYSVTVTDAFGCSGELTLSLNNSATNDLEDFASISLFPNPSSGQVIFRANFAEPMEAQIEILNPLGQRIRSVSVPAADRLEQRFDLSDSPAGLYLVRLSAEGKTLVRKLVKEN